MFILDSERSRRDLSDLYIYIYIYVLYIVFCFETFDVLYPDSLRPPTPAQPPAPGARADP